MRIVDLTDAVETGIETLQQAAIMPMNYRESCGDLVPEELCAHVSKLAQLIRLASTLSELALDTLTEEQE